MFLQIQLTHQEDRETRTQNSGGWVSITTFSLSLSLLLFLTLSLSSSLPHFLSYSPGRTVLLFSCLYNIERALEHSLLTRFFFFLLQHLSLCFRLSWLSHLFLLHSMCNWCSLPCHEFFFFSVFLWVLDREREREREGEREREREGERERRGRGK